MNKPLNLKQLVQIVPLEEKIKQQVLEQEDNLTAGQKYKISKICWRLLETIFITRVKQKKQEMIKEIAAGTASYEKEDFKRIEDEVLADILIKLDEVKSQEELAEIKNKIKLTIQSKQKASSLSR